MAHSDPASSIAYVVDDVNSVCRRRVDPPPASLLGQISLFDEYVAMVPENESIGQGLRLPPTDSKRPDVFVVHDPPTAPAQVSESYPCYVDVPADGQCMFYCIIAGRDMKGWMQCHDAQGKPRIADENSGVIPLHSIPLQEMKVEIAKRDLDAAKNLRTNLAKYAIDHGDPDLGGRLGLDGTGGYPEEADLEVFAQYCGGGQFVLQCGDLQRAYGSGPLLLHIRFCLTVDGDGHGSGHYVLHQSWMPLPPDEQGLSEYRPLSLFCWAMALSLADQERRARATLEHLEHEVKVAKANLASIRRQRRLELDSPELKSPSDSVNHYEPDVMRGQRTLYEHWNLVPPVPSQPMIPEDAGEDLIPEVRDMQQGERDRVEAGDDDREKPKHNDCEKPKRNDREKPKRKYTRTPAGKCPVCWRKAENIPIGGFPTLVRP